ncbi:unnamed protein product [Arctogadus glacialis]
MSGHGSTPAAELASNDQRVLSLQIQTPAGVDRGPEPPGATVTSRAEGTNSTSLGANHHLVRGAQLDEAQWFSSLCVGSCCWLLWSHRSVSAWPPSPERSL